MKVTHAFGGTFPVTEKVIIPFFIIMLSITVTIFRKHEVPIRNFYQCSHFLSNNINSLYIAKKYLLETAKVGA